MGRKKCGLLIGMIIVWWMMCFHEQVVKAADYERQDIDSSQEKCEEEENRRRINEVCSELTNVLERYVTAITIVDRQACCQKLEDGYEVNLYDKAGQKVYSTVYPKEPWIKKITEDILEIGISTGSPARYVFYFHKESAKISDTYFNAKLLGNKYVAYMEDKNLIVTDIFREGIIYQRIERDFSKTADAMSAVTNIELMEDGSIWLEYYEGLEGEVKTERIVMEEREEGNPAEIEISPAERIDRVVAIDYEFIEKNHKILEYNICTEPRTDYENTALMKYLADDIAHDKEMCSRMDGSTPLEIDYFVYDFNADGLEDYLVCYHGIFWCGSGGNSVTMYIQQEDGTLKRCWGITMRLYDSYLPNEHSPVAVLNETVDGYYSFVIPYSNYIVSYHPETQSYAFDTRDTEQVITDFLDKNPFSFKLSYYENEELNESGIVYCNKESWQCEEGQLDTFQILGEHYEVEDITALRIFKRQENDICGEINIGDELESTDKLLIKYFGDYAISVYCKETEEAQDGKRIVEEISFIKVEVEDGEAPEELYRYLENEYYKIKENQMNLEKRINEKEDAVNRQMQVILEKNQDTITEFLNKYPEGL